RPARQEPFGIRVSRVTRCLPGVACAWQALLDTLPFAMIPVKSPGLGVVNMATADLIAMDPDNSLSANALTCFRQATYSARATWAELVEYFLPKTFRDWLRRKTPAPPEVAPLQDDLTRTKPGDELEQIIRMVLLNELTMLIEGPPGVGKTYTVLKV